jgi:hypothetical protein
MSRHQAATMPVDDLAAGTEDRQQADTRARSLTSVLDERRAANAETSRYFGTISDLRR